MGCNADKDMRSDVPCSHRRVIECQDCRCTFAVRYTDDVIQSLLDRVKELESKLGAVSQRESATREDAVGVSARGSMEELSQAAAPSVSAKEWRRWASENTYNGRASAARACDLAAAVTEWHEGDKQYHYTKDVSELVEIARAFARGEPLPQKGG